MQLWKIVEILIFVQNVEKKKINNMIDFIWLIFAHYVGDYVVQTPYLYNNKYKDLYILFIHSILWTACISIALEYIGILTLWKIIFLLIGHFLIDKIKILFPDIKNILLYDQIMHIIQCLIVFIL